MNIRQIPVLKWRAKDKMVTIATQIARYRRRAARIMHRFFNYQNRRLTPRQALKLAWLLAELRELCQLEQIHGPNAQVHPFELPEHICFARNSENGLFD